MVKEKQFKYLIYFSSNINTIVNHNFVENNCNLKCPPNADDMYTTTDTGGRRQVFRCQDDVLSYVSPHESPTATTSESKRFLAAKP